MKNEDTLGEVAKREFGAAVRAQRAAMSLTQEALATKMSELGCPMTQTTVAKIERGDRPTPISEAAVLAHIFGVSLAGLLPIDEASKRAAERASRMSKAYQLTKKIIAEQMLLRNATRRLLTAQDELQAFIAGVDIDETFGTTSAYGNLADSVRYLLSAADPVKATEKAVEEHRDHRKDPSNSLPESLVAEVELAQERALDGEHPEEA